MLITALAVLAVSSGCLGESDATVVPSQSLQQVNAVCPSGAYLTGLSGAGTPACAIPLSAFECPPNQFVTGFGLDGQPTCALPATPPTTSKQSQEVTFKVVGLYGLRRDASSNLEELRVHVELPAGSPETDLQSMVLRYSTDGAGASYTSSAAATPSTFKSTWIRGTGPSMKSGDLVEFALRIPAPLGPSTSVKLTFYPETGSSTYNFTTPSSFGSSTTINLR